MNDSISILPINAALCRVDCSLAIANELFDYFSFYAPNFKFHPLFKQRRWDGKIHLFNKKMNTIPTGLIPRIRDFARNNDYSFTDTIKDESISIAPSRFDSMQFSYQSQPITPHNYQIIAMQHCVIQKRAIILSPTSSGKSLIIAGIIRALQEQNQQILLVVPSINLVEQMKFDIAQYFTDWDSESLIHCVYGGISKDSDKPIMISTWQSLMQLPRTFFARFNALLIDEVHQAATSKELQSLSDKCSNANLRFGFTGTLNGEKLNQLTLEGIFGKIHTTITTNQLIDDNKISDVVIKALILRHPPEIAEHLAKIRDYQTETKYLITYQRRNEFIATLCKKLNGNALVLFNLVQQHGKPLFKLITEYCPHKMVYFISGEVKAEEREEIRRLTETRDDVILIATSSIFSTGVSIRNLHNLVITHSTKSKIRILQSIGRVLRKHDNKDLAKVFDIVDDLRVVGKRGKVYDNYAYAHFLERLNHYTEVGLNVEFKEFNI